MAGVGEEPRLFLEGNVGDDLRGVIGLAARGAEPVEQRPADFAGVRMMPPRITSASVVLPEPVGPTTAQASPSRSVQFRSERTAWPPPRDGDAFSSSRGRFAHGRGPGSNSSPAPSASSIAASSWPMASGVSAGPVWVATIRRLPSGDSTAPRRVSMPSATFDVTPIGTRQPPPSA